MTTFNNDAFNQARRQAGITSAQFADFVGISRWSARQIELCRDHAGPWAFAALDAILQHPPKTCYHSPADDGKADRHTPSASRG